MIVFMFIGLWWVFVEIIVGLPFMMLRTFNAQEFPLGNPYRLNMSPNNSYFSTYVKYDSLANPTTAVFALYHSSHKFSNFCNHYAPIGSKHSVASRGHHITILFYSNPSYAIIEELQELAVYCNSVILQDIVHFYVDGFNDFCMRISGYNISYCIELIRHEYAHLNTDEHIHNRYLHISW